MFVDVSVLVPGDRVQEFQTAYGAWAAGRPFSDPMPGSSCASWQALTVQVADSAVADFYEAFGCWLATAATPTTSPTEMTVGEVKAMFQLLPRMEKDLLRLLADDGGRIVGWAELKSKFCLAGKPSVHHAVPHFALKCTTLGLGIPVHQEGADEDAVFSLSPGLVSVIQRS